MPKATIKGAALIVGTGCNLLGLRVMRIAQPIRQQAQRIVPERVAAARRKWRFGVKDFADRADAGLSEMRLEAVEKVLRLREIIGVDLEPGIGRR